jgi:hypothetical protein
MRTSRATIVWRGEDRSDASTVFGGGDQLPAEEFAQAREADAGADPATGDADTTVGRGGVTRSALAMVLTQLVMVAITAMTPVHMHGHDTVVSCLVIAIHSAPCTCPHR